MSNISFEYSLLARLIAVISAYARCIAGAVLDGDIA
jgi:hypothetical protein